MANVTKGVITTDVIKGTKVVISELESGQLCIATPSVGRHPRAIAASNAQELLSNMGAPSKLIDSRGLDMRGGRTCPLTLAEMHQTLQELLHTFRRKLLAMSPTGQSTSPSIPAAVPTGSHTCVLARVY